MKKIKLILFTTILLCFSWRFILTKYLYSPSNFKIPYNKTSIIMGASHGSYGINPKYSKEIENINVIGEILFFTEKKLEYFLQVNPHIEDVYITISPDSFAQSKKDLLVKPEHLISYSSNHHFLLSPKDLIILFNESKDIKDGFTNIKNIYLNRKSGFIKPSINEREIINKKLNKENVKINDYDSFKGYVELVGNDNQTEKWLNATIKNRFYLNDEITHLSPLLTNSLFKMGETARKHDVNLHLLITPKLDEFLTGIPNTYLEEYNLFLETFLKKYPEVNYLDLSKVDSFTSDLFHDYDHLNSNGAKTFTKYLNDNIF